MQSSGWTRRFGCAVGCIFQITCSAPCDYILRRSYPLFRAREVLEYLALGEDAAPGVTAPLATTPD